MPVAPWTNADGLQVKFGNYHADAANFVNQARALNVDGAIKQLEIDVELKRLAVGVNFTRDLNNDGTLDGFDTGYPMIPANASIIRAIIVSKETATSGTSAAALEIGLHQVDGTVIDDDGIMTATEGALANMVKGDRILGAGAFAAATAGTNGIGAANGYVSFKVDTEVFTAGKLRVIIEYVEI